MKKITIVLAFFILQYSCFATQYRVASVTEFSTVMQSLKQGDTVIWKNGTYTNMQVRFQPKYSINSTQKTVLMAETAGKVVFTGNSKIVVDGSHLQVEGFLFLGESTLGNEDVLSFTSISKYCRINNCAVTNYSPSDSMINNNWMSIQGSYNEVDHCSFYGKTNQGPYLVVRYTMPKNFVAGSDAAEPGYHHIHHNYFGYRTMPTDNGGEDMRIGDSKTSFTKGFNVIEYNYFEEHRLEPEVISNKSCDNIYRFNTFIGNDGALVLRHGERCFVYGNYINGKANRGQSGGIRIINAEQTVFNNFLENIEGGARQPMKAAIAVMAGLEGSALNEYYPANNALIACNTVVNSKGTIIRIGVGNASKGKPFVYPTDIHLIGNIIMNETKADIVAIEGSSTLASLQHNLCVNCNSTKGFEVIQNSNNVSLEQLTSTRNSLVTTKLIDAISQRLSIHKIKISSADITQFNPLWKLNKNQVGVSFHQHSNPSN